MTLSPVEAQHSATLASLIRGEIRSAGGWLSFERFMQLALYAPGLGYYSAGAIKIGAGGDFVTAPEVSLLFGRCLARQCAQVLAAVQGEILELGAGTGRLAGCVLTELAALEQLPERYLILEVSADLAARQRERLQRLAEPLRRRLVWLDRLPEHPLRGVILANEVLDALPTRRFALRAGQLREVGVALEGEQLIEAEAAPDAELSRQWSRLAGTLPALPPEYESEIGLRVTPWVASLGDCLEHGAMLLTDYGLPRSQLYHPQRVHGTLRCHFKQQAHNDPYINIGVQDITAWVDFTQVAEAALDAGLEVAGFTTQAAFLLATGIEQLVAAASDAVLPHARLAGEARRLLLPGEMGEAFKAMALTRGELPPLIGFTVQDLRPSL